MWDKVAWNSWGWLEEISEVWLEQTEFDNDYRKFQTGSSELYRDKEIQNRDPLGHLGYITSPIRNTNLERIESFQTLQQQFWICGSQTLLAILLHFHRGHLRPMENTDIYITIPNSIKLQLWRSGVTRTWGTIFQCRSVRRLRTTVL